ncbi:hypothetical protein [Mycobacterium sp. E2733]|uniref:hypothetical protein n=1 Tax=Mycobacterium sp. E2733 TaxID=1834138 RepID=UPI0012EB019D|nr:hypothetical protein [Mycobacterium sp. E2733]
MTATAWAVWVRRATCRIPWERSTTYAIIQLGAALVLIAPAAQPISGRLLLEVTGRWHVSDLLGHMLELGALVSSNLAGMLRMPAMRKRIVPLLWHPLVLGTAVLYFLFWQSVFTHNPGNDLFRLGHDGWLGTYFALFWALLVYYGGLNAWIALAHLRGDPRARPVALTWLVCVGLGAGAMVGWLFPWLGWTAWYDWGRLTMCVAVTVFAVASARSWQRKLRQWRGLIKVTGARI